MIGRRRALQLVAAGAAGAGAWGGWQWLAGPSPPADRESVAVLVRRVFESLPEEARATASVPFDHPYRQYFNRGLRLGAGLRVTPASLSWDARRDLAALLHQGLSDAGRGRVLRQDMTRWAGANLGQLLFCGDPRTGPCLAIVSTVHLNLRLGGASPEGAAFGGPQVYGDQGGDGRPGLPGNVYRYQMAAAHRLVEVLTPAQRGAVRVARAPSQVDIVLQGRHGRHDGLAVAEMPPVARALARATVAGILDTYAEPDAAYAWQCLDANGGVDALHFADYDSDSFGGAHAGDRPSQIFRFSGPATVLHFRGAPHVHAFVNIAMDGDRPLSLGEAVAENLRMLAGDELRDVFLDAMRAQGEADGAVYAEVAGRLRPGLVRTGDLWVAESWGNDLVVVEARGEDLAPPAMASLARRGVRAQARTTYRIATTDHLARQRDWIGRGHVVRTVGPLRDALASHLRSHGFRNA